MLAGCAATSVHTVPPASIELRDGLGHHHYAVATEDPLAQRLFDQGLVLWYAESKTRNAAFAAPPSGTRSA
ncbi:MAG: hypothetical protein R3E12_07035 [Candidatus Eisenbacteria bacterium]